MTGLLLVLVEPGTARSAAALEVAATTAALGRPVRVLLKGPAAAALAAPGLGGALATLRDLGALVALCPTAMADAGLCAADLPAGIEPLGVSAFLSGSEGWQLLLA